MLLSCPGNRYQSLDVAVSVYVHHCATCLVLSACPPALCAGQMKYLTTRRFFLSAAVIQQAGRSLSLALSLSLCVSLFQVVSKGLYLGERAYLRSSWNILDGFLVFVSLVDIVVSMAGGAKILGVLRVLRLLRTLRPLRCGIVIALKCLLKSCQSRMNAAVIYDAI